MIKASKSIFLLISLIFFNITSCHSQSPQAPFAMTCNPYLQNLNQNEITIMWLLNNNAISWVEYGKTAELGKKAIHSQSGMIDVNPGPQKVVLTDLDPGTQYFYRVASKEVKLLQPYKAIFGDTIFSQTYSFTTPSPTLLSFSFLAFNDIHSKPQFLEGIVKRESGFSFAMLNGDILGDITTEEEIPNSLLKPFSSFFATGKPFFLTRGNHETRGAGARLLSKYIDTPTGKYYYSFTYGNTFFVVLDCGEDKPDDNVNYFGLADYDEYRSQEAEWLEKEVQKPEFKKAAHRIVCIHMPISLQPGAEEKTGHGPYDCSMKFAPILNKVKIDLLLAGHTHRFKVTHPEKGVTNFPLVTGGGPYNEKDPGKTTYTLVEVSKSGIKCFLKKVNGEVIEEVE